jgi:hypothetical protein
LLQIFIVLKNPSPSAGFEPANFGSSGKYINHYTTEDDSTYTQTDLSVLKLFNNAVSTSDIQNIRLVHASRLLRDIFP